MRHKGPIITLAVGVALAGVLLVINLSVTKDDQTATPPAATATSQGQPANGGPASPGATSPKPIPTGPQLTYAGKVGDAQASIAIAVKDGKAIAYFCDGKILEAWLQGPVSPAGAVSLTGAKNATLTAGIANGVATGTVTAGGKQFTFSVPAVAPPSGVYRAAAKVNGAQVVAGWIVLENGETVGMVNYGDHEDSAPPLIGNSSTISGTSVTAAKLDGSGL